ncbi:MAG: hypothetical protein LH473_02415 [Chitinophagales bacterium]|nr:hypothetical protein [Chitinophagales bacterium]
MDTKKKQVVSLPEYKGDLSKLFDFEQPISMKEAFAMHKKHEQVVKKLSTEFLKRYREEMAK